MNITREMIKSWEPCYSQDDLEIALDRLFGDRRELSPADVMESDRNIYHNVSDMGWLILRPEIIGERLCHEVGIYCWEEISRPIWEKCYPDDKRPHIAIETRKRWYNGDATDDELDAAEFAAWSAAMFAADFKAESAARSAARSAAWSAAWSAARSADWEKIYTYIRSKL